MSAPERMDGAGASLSIWRDAPSVTGLRTAALGGFSCENAAAGARLLRDASRRLRDEGIEAVLGPMDGDTWATHRLVVESDGSPPFLMEPNNPDFYPGAFETAGFTVAGRYVSAVREAEKPPPVKAAQNGIVLRSFNRDNPEEDLKRIHALSLEAFADNAYYKPISAERFIASYRPVIGFIDPDFVILAEDEKGALKGFLFGVPNFSEGQKPEAIILKTYASREKGLGSVIANVFHNRAYEKGYKRIIHALMHESNLSATHSDNLGARVFRRYALWGKRL